MSRLLIVSNRLPVTVGVDGETVRIDRSVGGLATGLSAPHAASGSLWIGWPGLEVEELTAAQREQLDRNLRAERLEPIHLTADQLVGYYTGFSNGVVWPTFHYLTNLAPPGTKHWDDYLSVNRRFADRVAKLYQPGDLIWVHDYHLFPLPALLRERLPDATIGFFLHIPFPAPEVFRTLPRRREILSGVLGADLIGFHAVSYQRHFSGAVHHLLGLPTDVDQIVVGHRAAQLRVLPMGIDGERFSTLAQDPSVLAECAEIRGDGRVRLMLSIDRLDYSKGLPRRLLAFEQLLRAHPELTGRVRLLMLVVPSREDVGAYQEFRETINALIGRINGAFGTAAWTPVHYMYRGLPEREVVALYRAADVMLVTPIRDGMNLVAKEYVASRPDDDGVLVLSEFAGAADEMVEAVLVNPYEVEDMAAAFHVALAMPTPERQRRMRSLRVRVLKNSVHDWVATFLTALEDASETRTRQAVARSSRSDLSEATAALVEAPARLMLLDYDGTLVPFNPDPERAVPDAELLELLRALTTLPATEVHVVSGRPRRFLERWLGGLPLGLHAEHGAWSRPRATRAWTTALPFDLAWRGLLRPLLDDFVARTPGAFVEDKELGLAWHWRAADETIGARHANELGLQLLHMAANLPVDVLPGHHVIELRPQGVSKALVGRQLAAAAEPDTAILAAGDDRTDEELFASLPAEALTVRVGPRSSRGRFSVTTTEALRSFLGDLIGRLRDDR